MKSIKILSAALVIFACTGCAKQPYYSKKISSQLEIMAKKAEKKLPESGIAQALQKVIVADSKESAENARDKALDLCRNVFTQTLEPKRSRLLIYKARQLLLITQNCTLDIIEAWHDNNTDIHKRAPILDTPEAQGTIAGHFAHHLTTCDLIDLEKKMDVVCTTQIFVDNLQWYNAEIGDIEPA